jgi:Mlc titration factor MtfA (ptsG expression regulator)
VVLITAFSAALLAGLFKGGIKRISSTFYFFFKEHVNRYLPARKLSPKYQAALQTYFRFYNELSPADKHHFELRVQKFINMKDFIARGALTEVTPEMKALIAGTAIQITFGFPKVYFEHFWRILVYKSNYYSEITQKYHQGEVNMRGMIVLSWDNFVQGFVEHDSGKNLGYHEMAHALRLENAIVNSEYGFLEDDALQDFTTLANAKINSMRQGRQSLLRDYAAANAHEFFAVVIENFFERPKEFYKYDPDLYKATARIMRQDPIAKRFELN